MCRILLFFKAKKLIYFFLKGGVEAKTNNEALKFFYSDENELTCIFKGDIIWQRDLGNGETNESLR